MPRKSERAFNPDAPYQSINNAAFLTGVSRCRLREGCKTGRLPHIVSGSGSNAKYLLHMESLLELLEAEARLNAKNAENAANAREAQG